MQVTLSDRPNGNYLPSNMTNGYDQTPGGSGSRYLYPNNTHDLNPNRPKTYNSPWNQGAGSSGSKQKVGQDSVTSPSRNMPVDLVLKLRRADNDSRYEQSDDEPVDYSRRTNEVQSSRNTAAGAPRITVSTESKDKQQQQSSRFPQSRDALNAKIAEITAQSQEHIEDEMPKDFSRVYPEERLMPYEMSYAPPPSGNQGQGKPGNKDSLSLPIDHSDNTEGVVNKGGMDYSITAEERDKFDDKQEIHSGAMTPHYHYYPRTSGRRSGTKTPNTPMILETPLVYSRNSSCSSLGSFDQHTPASDLTSDPGSRMVSGMISPSELPDSPGQSMPASRSRSLTNLHEAASKAPPRIQNARIQQNPLPPHNLQQPPPIPVKAEQQNENNNDNNASPSMNQPPNTDDAAQQKPDNNNQGGVAPKAVPETDDSTADLADLYKAGNTAVSMSAGYVTSLPTTDEIKTFVHEGSMSPMTAFSEISALQEHNSGFQRGRSDLSFASRSSATGESAPNPNAGGKKEQTKVANTTTGDAAVDDVEEVEENSFDTLTDDSSDDDGDGDSQLLNQCISDFLSKNR